MTPERDHIWHVQPLRQFYPGENTPLNLWLSRERNCSHPVQNKTCSRDRELLWITRLPAHKRGGMSIAVRNASYHTTVPICNKAAPPISSSISVSQFAVDVLDRPRSRSLVRLDIPQAAGAGCDSVCNPAYRGVASCRQYRMRRSRRRERALTRMSVFSAFHGSGFWSKSVSPGRRKQPSGLQSSPGPVFAPATDGFARAGRLNRMPFKRSRFCRRYAMSTRGAAGCLSNSNCISEIRQRDKRFHFAPIQSEAALRGLPPA